MSKRRAVYLVMNERDSAFFNTYLRRGDYQIIGSGPPFREDWKQSNIAKSIARHASKIKGYPLTTGIIYEENEDSDSLGHLFSEHIMDYFLLREMIGSNRPYSASFRAEELMFVFNGHFHDSQFMGYIADMQSFLYISRKHKWPTMSEIMTFSHSNITDPRSSTKDPRLIHFVNSRRKFKLIDRFGLQDDYTAYLYLYKMQEIKKDGLSLEIFNGRIKFFYQGRELTKDMGFSSNIECGDKTYRYYDAVWDYKILDHGVEMIGEWPSIGIKQYIFIMTDPKEKNTVGIDVEIETKNDVILNGWDLKCMFSDGYKEWLRPFLKGDFKEIPFSLNPGGFESISSDYNGIDLIGFKENKTRGLPALLFRRMDTGFPMDTGLYNTDYSHSARCIIVTADEEKINLSRGTRKRILSIRVSVTANEVLERILSQVESEEK